MLSTRSFKIKLTPVDGKYEKHGEVNEKPETYDMACQTDSQLYLQSLCELAEREWEQYLDTTTRMKFEQLKEKHQNEITRLLKHIREEKHFREKECQNMFKQWLENISLQCTLTSTHKFPLSATNSAPSSRRFYTESTLD